MNEETIRDVLVAAVQGKNGSGVKETIVEAAEGLAQAATILADSLKNTEENKEAA